MLEVGNQWKVLRTPFVSNTCRRVSPVNREEDSVSIGGIIANVKVQTVRKCVNFILETPKLSRIYHFSKMFNSVLMAKN